MKLKQMMHFATITAAIAFSAASISAVSVPAFPSIPLSVSGTVYYTTNYSTNMGAPIKLVSYNSQSLIHLLNVSTNATNVIFQVTGKTQIPAGSSFLWNPWDETLIITNANHFSFPFEGSYSLSGSTKYYDFGYLEMDSSQLIGTYKLDAKTKAGSETDRTGIFFYFYDGAYYENELEIYGTATLNWTYGAVTTNGTHKATLSVTMTGPGNDDCYIADYDAIPATFSATGTGSGNATTNEVPLYYNY